MELQARDKRALIVGGVVVTALLAYLLWPSGPDPRSNVELVAADRRPPAVPAPTPTPLQAQTVATPAPIAVASSAGAVTEGLVLTGVAGSGAIFAFADGSQRFVPRGREVVPGLTLQAVSLRHVILGSTTMSYRLGLGGSATSLGPPQVTAPPSFLPPNAPGVAPGPSGEPPAGNAQQVTGNRQ